MDIFFVKKYLQKNLGFSDEKIDKIRKYIDLLLILGMGLGGPKATKYCK